MPSPFPGMDPYLESPKLWPDFHNRLIVYLAEHLRPMIRPRYVASVGTRVYIEGPNRERLPDVYVHHSPGVMSPQSARGTVLEADAPIEVHADDLEIKESFLQIVDVNTNQRVVTCIEAVSPTNKYAGPGRDSYLAKQSEVRGSEAHLVEMDLLRAGPHVLAVPEHLARAVGPYDYLVSVNRAQAKRTAFQLYPRRLPERLPRFRCPLAIGDDDVVIDLQAVVHLTYERSGYEDVIQYDQRCTPPLSPEVQAWANELFRQRASGVAES